MAEFMPLGGASALAHYFGWAGNLKGDTDIVISSPTTWDDIAGFKKVRKLTINANQTLRIKKSPFYIFADEIVFGNTASCIDASGFNGDSPLEDVFTAKGGGPEDTDGNRGGDGGGMLFVVTNKVSGANGLVKANGGDGAKNASVDSYSGGQGALSTAINLSSTYKHNWTGTIVVKTSGDVTYLHPLGFLLGDGGGNNGGKGGASGNKSSGGSGIGGGGGGSGGEGKQSPTVLTPCLLLTLAQAGCLGGGGGGSDQKALKGGGGGGSVCFWSKVFDSIPVLQANGGDKGVGGYVGAAGVTHLIQV